jgi:hypothetical protein
VNRMKGSLTMPIGDQNGKIVGTAVLKLRESKSRSVTTHRKPGEVADMAHKTATSPVQRARTIGISTAVGRSLWSPARRAISFTIAGLAFSQLRLITGRFCPSGRRIF